MYVSYRPARPAELASCFHSMAELYAFPADIRGKVPQLWSQWLQQGVLTSNIFERHEQGRVSVEAFSAMVFLRDGFIDEFQQRGKPYLRQEIIRRSLAGENVVLTPGQMREQNRNGGLTMLILNDPRGGTRELSEERIATIDTKWSEGLYELCGCNMKSIWHEVYGEQMKRRVTGCGLNLYQDWSDYWATHGSKPSEGERPYLMGLTREEAKTNLGRHASFLFTNTAPQFEFTIRQQELLQEALQGATDDELANQLNVSPSAVKKRWISVYDRVSDAMPGWLESAATSEARGSEKRRRLLNYLRQHPEELHPAWALRE